MVGVLVGTGVSVGVGVSVDVRVGIGVKVSTGRKLVDVEAGKGEGEAGACPLLPGPQADVISIKIMNRKNLICFMC